MAPVAAIVDVAEEEDYASAEDSDFAPETAQAAPESSSSEASESEADAKGGVAVKKPKKLTKRKRTDGEAEDIGYDNSGDEAIIGKGLKKRKKGKGRDAVDDDEGGEGGFVRTRAMKAATGPEEKRKLVSTEGATVDVDALWASMASAPLRPSKNVPQAQQNEDMEDRPIIPAALQADDDEPEMITITRTYNFAGVVKSETKIVSRYSAEAKLYLADQANKPSTITEVETAADDSETLQLRRPKAKRSQFEPATEPFPPRTDLRFKLSSYVPKTVSKAVNAKKLNTVQKSAMDWAGFVDKEGIKDDLETAAKAKGTYLDNQEFLLRADSKREEESRKARLKGLAV